MRPLRLLLLPALLLATPRPAAAWDAFNDTRSKARFALTSDDGLRLVLKGNARFGLFDLEGEGGSETDSTTDTPTIGTRSPYAAFDRMQLAFRLETPTPFAFYTQVRFEPGASRVEGAFVDLRHRFDGGLAMHAELGLNSPFVGVDRYTMRKSIAERSYWDRSELHATVEASHAFGPLEVWLGLSVGMMRPLIQVRLNDAADEGVVTVIAYGDNTSFSGIAPAYGAKAGIGLWHVVTLEGFGFVGQIAKDGGLAQTAASIPGFTLLPGYDPTKSPGEQDDTFWWAGGRVDAHYAGAELRVEAIWSQESLLDRFTAYAQAGYVFSRGDEAVFFNAFEPRVRVERYRLADGDRIRANAPAFALTWDWDVLTAALAIRVYRDIVRLHLEYSVIDETNGRAGQADKPLENNELTAQFELRF